MDITPEMRAKLRECIQQECRAERLVWELQDLFSRDLYPDLHANLPGLVMEQAGELDEPDSPITDEQIDQILRKWLQRTQNPQPPDESVRDDALRVQDWLIINRKTGLFWGAGDWTARALVVGYNEFESQHVPLPADGRWLHADQLKDFKWRCSICDEIVLDGEQRDHLIDHSPAYGAATDPAVTASMFEDVDHCDQCRHILGRDGACPVCRQ